ncbi:MAG TPA: hypothetical protein VII44_08315 [Puia sp.]
MNKPLLLLISAGYLVSCHKEASNPVNNWTWFGTQNNTVYNYVLINANQVLNNSDSEELHIGVSAAFIDSNNHQVIVVRTLSVNNLVIQPGQDSTYNYNYNFTSGEVNKGSQLFGTQVLVTIRGMDEADTVSSSIYVPKQLTEMISEYPDNLSLNKGLQLQWTPDNQNSWGNVMIQLYYYSSLSKKADSTMPDKISTVNLTVPDNGSYYLTKTDLSSFPCNAFIGITIARGTQNEALLPLSNKRVYYFSSASVSTPPVKLVQ